MTAERPNGYHNGNGRDNNDPASGYLDDPRGWDELTPDEQAELVAYYRNEAEKAAREVEASARGALRGALGRIPVAFDSSSSGRRRPPRRDAPRQVILVPNIRLGDTLFRAVRSPDHTDDAFDQAAHHGFEHLPAEERVRALRQFLGLPD